MLWDLRYCDIPGLGLRLLVQGLGFRGLGFSTATEAKLVVGSCLTVALQHCNWVAVLW